ncbi:DUF1178 family protein [Pseudahrensia aquimaris]|uniref:DUF1178 family protein n=1 Tax=Pseudahrensia aquimaris TaxID=744461 RepID=A0ABW3FBW1_9HYPH
MIRFSLVCENEHDFDGWFGSSEDYETQRKRGLVTCPSCSSAKVEKALMAPQVSTSRSRETVQMASLALEQKQALAELKKMRDAIVNDSENVGKGFAEEARKIHYGEAPERGIIGEANREEVVELLEEGVEIAPLPVLPGDAN